MGRTEHPKDLSPYLDGDFSDQNYEEIRTHLSNCPECSDEVQQWRSWEETFRSPDMQIEVPASQWLQIRARLESAPAPWWERWAAAFRPGRLAWSLAALAIVVGGVVSGLQYNSSLQERRQVSALTAFAESERSWIDTADNPFRSELSGDNPFKTPDASDRNPFVTNK
jgi:anti-sigma factor RsiW